MAAAGAPPADHSAPRSGARLLRLFADVRAGEAATALLLMVNVFLLFTAYYLIKPVREAFILGGQTANIFGWAVGRAEIKSYASALMALVLIFVIWGYGKLASAVPRQKLVAWVTLFFISNLVIFFLLTQAAVSIGLAIAFFVWVGIFNNMVVAQFWGFANDVYVPEQGKRLFPLVGFGASSGAVGGSWIAGQLFKPVGASNMLLIAAAILGVCIALTLLVHRREAAHRALRTMQIRDNEAEKPLGREGGFQLILKHKYLLYIALLVLVANIVNTTGEFILSKKVSTEAASAVAAGQTGGLEAGPWIGAFYSNFFFWVNLSTAILQLFIVSRIFKYAGVRAALFIMPLVALCGYTVLAFGAALGVVRLVKIAENSTDYSVQNTAKHSLFLPTTREMKYKAKAAIDTFFVRTGDFASALLVFVGSAAAFTVERFAFVNLLLVGGWILLALGVARGYRRASEPKVT